MNLEQETNRIRKRRPTPAAESPVRPAVLAVCNIDGMAWGLLRHWFIALQEGGYDVHVACAPGDYFGRLEALGFHLHPISMQRTFRPWAHVRPLFQLWKIMRRGQFAIVNTHSAVGAAIGRAAALLAGVRPVVYTVHGFLFHEHMPALPRKFLMLMEWILGRCTDGFMFVSAEDNQTALDTGIVPARAMSTTIYNGVDLDAFAPKASCPRETREFRRSLGIEDSMPVVGMVGRIVREKGYREFLEMARIVSRTRKVMFLIVGDTLPSDRDNFGSSYRAEVAAAGLSKSFYFAGHTDHVPEFLRIMDIFTLPSHREGFPRSIVEAMSAGLPVVTTNIRGCREAVVEGETGLIVPSKDGVAFAEAVEQLLADPRRAAEMGHAGRERAVSHYDYRMVQRVFAGFIDEIALRNWRGTPAATHPE